MDQRDVEVRIWRLKRRVEREKGAREEAESIADSKIAELHYENSLLNAKVNSRDEELRKFALQHVVHEAAINGRTLSGIRNILGS